jgi:hypothetical protein
MKLSRILWLSLLIITTTIILVGNANASTYNTNDFITSNNWGVSTGLTFNPNNLTITVNNVFQNQPITSALNMPLHADNFIYEMNYSTSDNKGELYVYFINTTIVKCF